MRGHTDSTARRSSLGRPTTIDRAALDAPFDTDRVFAAIDLSSDGFISVSELHIGLMSVTGQALSSEEAEKLVEKFDKNKDGQLNLEEFKMLCANQGKGKGFKGVFRAKPTKSMLSRETILAKELTKANPNSKPITVSDLRLLKPINQHSIMSLVYGLRFVESDFSCPGLYRMRGTKSKTKPGKLQEMLESGKRVSINEFREVVGDAAAPVASAIAELILSFAPLISYDLYDDILDCKSPKDLRNFFETNSPPNGNRLSQPSLDFLGSFCIHLYDMCKFKDRNGMDVDQLCAPLSTLLLRRNEDVELDASKEVKENNARWKTFRMLVNNAEYLFIERDEFLWGSRNRPDPERAQGSSDSQPYNPSSIKNLQIKQVDNSMSGDMTKADEASSIMKAGDSDTSPYTWYIVPSKFIHYWLAYTSVKETMVEGVSERPKKLDNTMLLGVQKDTKMWYLKEGIKLASDEYAGDYRLVNKQTYMKFCEMYPGSGPIIFVDSVDRNDMTQYYIDQRQSEYARTRKVTDQNEFDEFTTDDHVFKRNEGPDGLNALQYVYRNSGLEDIIRGSAEALGLVEEDDYGEGVKEEEKVPEAVAEANNKWGEEGKGGGMTEEDHHQELELLLNEADEVQQRKSKVVIDIDNPAEPPTVLSKAVSFST
ncbi:hypothetical protein TL16_g10852 [Triparma laevis f. inornata]|uniref:Calmodulin n=1 Tax=Triparma laevis f. inornata TaxID=1714386 RepID=A0A9W7BAR7_9STRA|nr:hypothetical protein TL16_g10852 [Triparma laevis f. inornata]